MNRRVANTASVSAHSDFLRHISRAAETTFEEERR